MEDFYSKNIQTNEYNFYKILRGSRITPDIISISRDILNIEMYDCTLEELILATEPNEHQSNFIYKNINEMIKKMHKIGIFHSDLHSSNIVCKSDFSDFRIIDFEDATFINIIDNEFIEDYNGMHGSECKNLKELLEYEERNSWID